MRDSEGGHKYDIGSWFHHLVAQYTGMAIQQVRQLKYIEYLTYRRDAFIHRLNQTEAGQEYLKNAWRMEQTEPDREKLRRKFGRREARTNGG